VIRPAITSQQNEADPRCHVNPCAAFEQRITNADRVLTKSRTAKTGATISSAVRIATDIVTSRRGTRVRVCRMRTTRIVTEARCHPDLPD